MKMRGGHDLSNEQTYRTISGDMWDKIAYEEMGSSLYVDKLMKANAEYLDYFIFPAGIVLTIPVLEEEEAEELPLWKRGLLNE